MGKKVRPWKSIRPPPLSPETAETANATEHTPQPESNSRKGKIAVVALASGAAIVGIAVAFSLGGNKTTTPPQEPEVEDVIDDTEPSEEVVEIVDTPAENNKPEAVLPVEEEQHYEGSLTTEYIAEKFDCLSFTDAVKSDPEEVAEYISDWMYDNGYPLLIGDDITYNGNNVLISVYADYGVESNDNLGGVIRIENTNIQNVFHIRISNLTNPENIRTHEYESNEIPNYDTLLQIAQENLG